jgi:hypothetical protein
MVSVVTLVGRRVSGMTVMAGLLVREAMLGRSGDPAQADESCSKGAEGTVAVALWLGAGGICVARAVHAC